MKVALFAALAFIVAFVATLAWKLWPELTRPNQVDPAFRIPSPLELESVPTALHFDFPLGNENGAMAYNAQHFTENKHLGDDLNGIGGENSDLGDPIYAVADGRVQLARDGGPGWGNVIIILHAYLENGAGGSRATSTGKPARGGESGDESINGERKYVQSYYGHVQDMLVHPGETVKRGQQIATVGTANGRYFAHLHFEMREFLTPFIGPGYRDDTRGWINPTKFIENHR
ncbi:MAG TPA: M23 family metallopeptidase [Chthoniobacterales bacterium]|jgi:peptidase M23-like protein|nr:M23 family metallopeptidase [Chthoniobacterales bacterium]